MKTEAADSALSRAHRSSRAELGYFFESEIRPGLRGSESAHWSEEFHEGATYRSPALRQVLAILENEQHPPTTAVEVGDLNIGWSVLYILHEWSQQFHSKALEKRVTHLERDLASFQQSFRCLVEESTSGQARRDRTAKRLAPHLPAIREACWAAFGHSPNIMLLAADDPDRALSVNLDLSEAEPARVSEARSSGGRRRFYEAAIQALPRDLFDELDFDFIFPRHES